MLKQVETGAVKKTELGQDIFNTTGETVIKTMEFTESIFDTAKKAVTTGVEAKQNAACTLEEKVTTEKTGFFGGFINAIKDFFTQDIKDKNGNNTGITPLDVAINTINPMHGVIKVIGNRLDCES